MNIEELTEYCQTLECVGMEIKWEDVLVFTVGGKIFCLVFLPSNPLMVNLKCDPEEAIDLRERHAAVTPGYHMNKKYWNTVTMDGTVDDGLVREWIGNSYRLVADKLPKALRQQLGLPAAGKQIGE